MKQVIAMHGWCSDSNRWRSWEEHFRNNGWIWQSSERGYGDIEPCQASWTNDYPNTLLAKKVLICHSLGTHLIPSKIFKEATHIVLLNSFSRFLTAGKESRSLKVALGGMQKHFKESTEESMLIAFLEKASSPNKSNELPPGPIKAGLSFNGRERLQDDLNLLINTKGLPIGFSKEARVLVINGDKDEIILPSSREELLTNLSQHLNSPPIHWIIRGAGHSIFSSQVIKDVRDWLE